MTDTGPWGLGHTRAREVPCPPWMCLSGAPILVLGQGSREIRGPSAGAETLVGAMRCSGEEVHPGAILCCSCSGESPGESFCRGALCSQASSSSRSTVCSPQASCHQFPIHASLSGLSRCEGHTMNPWLTSHWGTRAPPLPIGGYNCQVSASRRFPACFSLVLSPSDK